MSDHALACPSCRQPMAARTYARALGENAHLDICWSCRAIWFDAHESTQLAPAGVIALFREIHENTAADHPLAAALRCPRCPMALALRQDLARAGRFAYYRCDGGHGRLTPFNQFLIEKGFVRTLRPAEIATLKARIATVRCNGCGAPVDLARDTACAHCRAPISVLDADAVDKALAAYAAAANKPAPRAHDVVAELVLQHERDRLRQQRATRTDDTDAVDLLAAGLAAVLTVFS
ncbi:MAG: zf-TFIIB domain-containing protein [Burkholderiales bacterium]|nr:zf-TFIIB domain-containing protein [Burkholderiales bacterium]